ncbi:hypothetical protein ACH9EU_05130 [Kocuria sp. M1R5S2]|uniref:hypothetical protein n=1 Tax=Kocuria rhizosphaerae TaxID=3376285 RepID=UPI0037AE0B5E
MIWVSSSAVLVVVCALSLFWVVPRLQRDREDPAQDAEDAATDAHSTQDGPVPPDELPPPVPRPRRITMATTDTTSRSADSGTGHRSGSLRIRWDRAGVFLAGCAAVLAALVTAVLAPLTAAVTWPWPVFLLLLGAGSVLALRYLAVHEHAARRAARPAPAEDPHAPRADVALFDNEHGLAPVPAEGPDDAHLDLPAGEDVPAAPPSFTVEELRAEALRVAQESSAAARTWEPVPVPRPTYAEAPVVHRPEPEPLTVPEQPAARSTNLKDAVRAGEEQGRAALNLDDVLRRRRA